MLNKKLLSLLLAALMLLGTLSGCSLQDVTDTLDTVNEVLDILEAADSGEAESLPQTQPQGAEENEERGAAIDRDGSYTSKEDVALYIYTYGCLPNNFVTKDTARDAGWNGGGLDRYLPGMCIGGDRFGNREGLLPDAPGRKWTECDINTLGADSRGAERIVFSNDGLIYYTGDHYESFELLYGEP